MSEINDTCLHCGKHVGDHFFIVSNHKMHGHCWYQRNPLKLAETIEDVTISPSDPVIARMVVSASIKGRWGVLKTLVTYNDAIAKRQAVLATE